MTDKNCDPGATPSIDYRGLLQRYMLHVLCEEGTTFTVYLSSKDFNEDERAVLEAMADEAHRQEREFLARVRAERAQQ